MAKAKWNILDFFLLLSLLLVLALSFFRFVGDRAPALNMEDGDKDVVMEVLIVENKGFFDVIQIGDQLSETKKDLDAYVAGKEVKPLLLKSVDPSGMETIQEDPMLECCLVKIEGKLPEKNGTMKLGASTARAGNEVFVESKLYQFKGRVQKIQVIEDE